MMRHPCSFLSGLVLAVAAPCMAFASPLVYTPVNPSFGGSPFNGSVLLGEANAQNHFQDHRSTTPTLSSDQTLGDLFQTGVVNQLQQQVFTDITAGSTNSVTVGSVTISYHPNTDHTQEIVTVTGPTGSTTINVPL